MKDIMKVLFFLDVICLIYFFIRGPWLFRVRREYYRQVYSMLASQKGEPKTQEEMDELSKYTSPYYDAIWGFSRTLFCFWKWDLSKMVSDKQKFDEVANFSGEETLCTH
ncbi:MAG: hypothetical protein UX02_C0003G0008 [Candidatus Moranbacteria bacterium GW2011_GWC1_45_18]|nr:MAG: hypothetical protein UT79_C0004G0008 [Candidatus Moranbacteria bacterium GW2011_GWC2_40_12]KKT33617.1 MAG: hypothetical protein UW19_C0007G0008 [Candidatus Moranbacteria bacterium GW2011_GWF2_44_10]KKT72317.1 MAG: hypothetical protein UW66_C0006G0013 [Candidatus Moranbacteria bacterium GW2011_GWF1_44_4]KKT99465.1 MAG: hypothetical protein UX02_C0003G0008 [Candidatus Moranbacteria bacterium GW2011_GWC1_45_18]OGI22372.1 MAG: hypothetical protein A2194_00960 [Candidatus Moranbacteria bacte